MRHVGFTLSISPLKGPVSYREKGNSYDETLRQVAKMGAGCLIRLVLKFLDLVIKIF